MPNKKINFACSTRRTPKSGAGYLRRYVLEIRHGGFMRNKICLFIASLLIASCGGADTSSENSHLNGKWASSTCFQINLDPFNDDYKSLKMVMEFNNGEIINKLHQYTDIECTIFGREINNGLFANLNVSYTIGENKITAYDENVRDIDFVSDRGDLLPDIYLLINSGTTLYFGKKEIENMIQCPSDEDLPFPGPDSCWTIRPSTIDYNVFHSKIDP